jgi:outer membrane protein assembly factor BamA
MVRFSPGKVLFLITFAGLVSGSSDLFAQGPGVGGNGRIEDKCKFIPVPYLNYDRSLGFSVGAVPLLMFNPSRKDTISPSSLLGGVGLWTTNKTWFLLGFGMFHLGEDRWRITTAGGTGAVNFQFYLDGPINIWVPYQSEAVFLMLKVERRIYEQIYGGLSYVYADVVTSTENLPLADSLTIRGIGLSISMDRRSNPYYPRSGFYTNLKYNINPEFMGNENPSHRIELDHNHYLGLRQNRDVLAARFYAALGLGNISFSQQFIVRNTDIRGYTQGAYRGDYLLALQGEYRWNFHRRWGAVGFAGAATVFEGINDSDNGKLLPGIGTGIRFRAFPENNFSVGMDLAAGLGDWGIYFQIGEAF